MSDREVKSEDKESTRRQSLIFIRVGLEQLGSSEGSCVPGVSGEALLRAIVALGTRWLWPLAREIQQSVCRENASARVEHGCVM